MSNSKISILLIDDDTLVANSLARLLRSKRYDVSVCPDPKTALQFCDKLKFDLIITDQRMHVMDGTAFAAQAKTKQPKARVILISGYSDNKKVMEAFSNGVIHKYICKPWDNNQLLTTIGEQLHVSKVGETVEFELAPMVA